MAQFEMHLEDNLFQMHQELTEGHYALDPYEPFSISDPKPRRIHKASVRDRVLNQAIFRILYPVFNKSFIFDSYSSRKDKGTHKGVMRLFSATRKVTANWNKLSYALKCDVEKFFDSVDHEILFFLIQKKLRDPLTLELIKKVIKSFEKSTGKGIPLGNVTSQLFANVYLNELDRFVKHELKAKYYFRYADDFVILDPEKSMLESYETRIREFLQRELGLKLHDGKVLMRKASQGIDFLGYVVLPHTIILRTKTKNRILKRIFKEQDIKDPKFYQRLDSYLGMLQHCKSRAIKKELFEYLIEK